VATIMDNNKSKSSKDGMAMKNKDIEWAGSYLNKVEGSTKRRGRP